MDPENARLLGAKPGETLLLLGNEAIARAALEVGIDLAATYPGTPSSEIGLVLADVARDAGFRFEWAVNEKVAMEVGAAAALAGRKALVFMKHVGLNVASDALTTLAYTGVRGALVVVTADDPGCHSSQNEQDNRLFARFANIAMLEPSNPQEALEFTRFAFEFSTYLEMPVIVRTTTRVAHARGPVTVGKRTSPSGKGRFERDPPRFVMIPSHAREGHKRVLQRMKLAEGISETTPFNRVMRLHSEGDTGIVTSGAAYTYVADYAEDLTGQLLKLGLTNPLPREKIASFMKGLKRVVVIEELEPYLEDAVRAIANEKGIEVVGKAQGLTPRAGELDPDAVAEALVKTGVLNAKAVRRMREAKITGLPARPPILCPGCGHRSAAFAARQATRRVDAVFPLDIGCYALLQFPPLSTGDVLLCMGASIGVGAGLAALTDQKVIAFIGDSTFYHAGVPALIHAVHQGVSMTVCILDNATTAMTGHQPHPGIAEDGKPAVDMEALVRGCGVKSLEVHDAYDVKALTKAFRAALGREGVSVIIARHECRLLENRRITRSGARLPLYAVDVAKCTKCGFCIDSFACPALVRMEDESVAIDVALCSGCGVCADVCPPKAVVRVEEATA
ncbi:MAG: indolepyruvate ferredoxin oxidoreductase subunit alpha [Euryarchaeota archaeon RBG_16_68_12]|nr:MAG: indolepyruvate ferredoxin oxidoreductase subunit alpha [Euryarchaeota archaeon RBG_16_68_12]